MIPTCKAFKHLQDDSGLQTSFDRSLASLELCVCVVMADLKTFRLLRGLVRSADLFGS